MLREGREISCAVVDSAGAVGLLHRLRTEVAAFRDRPFVVLLEEDGADQTDDRGGIGKDADDCDRRLISLFNRSSGFVLCSCR